MSTEHVPRRRGLVVLASVISIGLAASFAIDAGAAAAQATGAQQQVSQNWSGYVVHSSAAKSFSSVSADWTQPAVSSSTSGDGYAAFWVGLGGAGQGSQALEQVGTSAQTVGGRTSYSAWYELVPASEVALPLTIHRGDHMTGRVTVEGTTVTIHLADQSTGQSVTKSLQMSNPDTSSAEWIAEAPAAMQPDGSAQILPLANFGNVNFRNASATADGHTGSISDPAWSVEQVDMSGGSAAPTTGGAGSFTAADSSQQSGGGASTGNVSSDGTSFSVSYSSAATTGSSSAASSGYSGTGYPGYGSGYGDSGYGYSGYGDPGYGYSGFGYDGSGIYVYVQ